MLATMNQETKATIILILTTIFAGLGLDFFQTSDYWTPPILLLFGTRFVCASILLLPFCYKQIFALTRAQLINAASVGVLCPARCLRG